MNYRGGMWEGGGGQDGVEWGAKWDNCNIIINKYIKNIYIFNLLIFRGGEREREGEKHWCVRETSVGYLSHAPIWEPGPQLRHVHWLGMKPATFCSTGQSSVHWATPAMAFCLFLYWIICLLICRNSLCILNTSTMSNTCIEYFLPVCGLPFYFLDIVFW